MREAHGNRHFAGFLSVSACCLSHGLQQYKAREVFCVVLSSLGNDLAAIANRSAFAGNRGMSFVTARDSLAHASGGIFRGQPLDVRMLAEEAFALRQRHGMRRNGTDVAERGAWAGNQVHLDGQNRLRTDGKLTVQKQIVNTHHRASELSTGTSNASAAPSGMARNVASKVGRGTVTISSPSNCTAAASLKAPASP